MLNEMKIPIGKSVYIIEYPEFLIPKSTQGYLDQETKKRLIDLHKMMNHRGFLDSNHMLIFVTRAQADVHEMFLNANSRTVPILIEFPNVEERLDMIRYLKDSSFNSVTWELSESQFAKLTAGLSRVHLEDLYLLAEDKGILAKAMVMERKEELIRKEFGEVIEIFDTEGYSLDDFAGQEHIKEYHREAVIQPIIEGDTSFVPKGLLYMGPPGTGKTFFARCLAGEANINFVEFKMSKILNKYVGEAERNLEKAFNCFKSLAPVGVFIDEIDQALQRGGDQDGNPVNKNIFGMFLAFLSDPSNRGQILWVGATNYPNKLDEALKRAGRFDKKIPFFAPTDQERVQVFKYHFGKTGISCVIQNYEVLAARTAGYTQAEIENIVVKTLELAKRKNYKKIDDALVVLAMDYIISTQNHRIQEMTEIALEECNDLEFLPTKYREQVKEKRRNL
ncbi:ATP-dependent 26S proteasome regulatory subunit [Paenibacillus sp. 1182]|uniref:ATP-binding protein n=1 Tax=Paenibacillus sp. 1182 TaxID=2806565 RepID=UPI001B4C348F|nr:ATP-binding protein [Paenibacillus sp. 1182]MBP1308875.1 ATP-dependent 26S proteasome regulatory subunit [Paenibacillus sp. 1182]